ncbi:maltokinase N-terminal cap-like domain-containing protein [Streptomyces sp. PR69]|uniref:maltokinase N-terminal cap-like domain-containing protein n=1 Tax=Streptomyces sp. PR69 TaxID=2984950 RepID=UPI002263D277|nr:1,4-alpha-glucan branching protein [Streptomyces sp. PR69]
MAVIHNTTLTPGKLELLAPWLPTQPWYAGTARTPELSKAGGFRLDDPDGVVGIEFMVVTDTSGDRPVTYHIPLSYRGAPLDGVDDAALIGTAEHGVLGRRWVYDGTHDPVLVAQLLALLQGRAEPQAQSLTDTPDRSVTRHLSGDVLPSPARKSDVRNGPHGTDVAVETAADGGPPAGPLTLAVVRVLEADGHTPGGDTAHGHITAGWRTPDGAEHRGRFALLKDAGSTAS